MEWEGTSRRNRRSNGIRLVEYQQISNTGLSEGGMAETVIDAEVCSSARLDALRDEIFFHRVVSELYCSCGILSDLIQ